MKKDAYSSRSAQSMMEYMTLVVFLMIALFVFQHYIVRAFSGNWKKAGDTFAFGQQYDPRPYGILGDMGGTQECFFDATHCVPGDPLGQNPGSGCAKINLWISKTCYDANCDCTLLPSDPAYLAQCLNCIQNVCSEVAAAGAPCAAP